MLKREQRVTGMLHRTSAGLTGPDSAGGVAIFNPNAKGFTLIELVMVIVLIGIMAAFIAPRLPNITRTNAGAFKAKLRADIRYAQDLAMTRGRRTRVNFVPATYGVTQDTSATFVCSPLGNVNDSAGGGVMLFQLNTGLYAGITIGPSTCIEFDSLGKPYDCTLAPAPGACSTSPGGRTITIYSNGVAVTTVTVSPETGAVN